MFGVELRRELRRVGQVASDAIGRLQVLGHGVDAERLTRELGETVDMLRVADNT